MGVTIATHNGSAVSREHNKRNEKVVSKEEHIDKDGIYEIWHDENPRDAYKRIFGNAVDEYNAKQTRNDRKIKNYYNDICKDAKKHPVYEMIIGVYDTRSAEVYTSADVKREILKEFVDTWNERNPNLELVGAYYHDDERGQPHVHIDYIPVAHGYEKGMETQTGLVKALGEQGFVKQGRATAQIQWESRENAFLEELCNKRGLEVEHPRLEGVKHRETALYKAERAISDTLDHTKELLDIQDDLRADISRLERKRDKAETQAERAIERKQKAFSKSFKKNHEQGFTYDATLKREIEHLVHSRSADVSTIKHTDLDVQMRYEEASATRRAAELDSENLRKKAQEELIYAENLRIEQEMIIKKLSESRAQTLFREFIQRELNGSAMEREKRLKEHLLKYPNGNRMLQDFERAEKALQERLEREWYNSHGHGIR